MFNPACSHYELCDNSKAFVREQTCHFSTKCIFTSYYVQISVAPSCLPSRKENFVRQISRLNARGCPFNFSVKIKYRVVAVSPQCSCRLLYVHPCLSSHGACACVCVRARSRAFMDARLPANLPFGGLFLRGMAKLERPPKILCSNWNCFIFSLIN